MRAVIGTAGHIDHGKTTLLRALTGIDADRLPEEQRRGMTIDVGYAHLPLPDGTVIDFVDVPGHDRLVGNMLVGAGEIDAAMLVVAADDGPRAQTLEHLELLDGLGFDRGLAVVTKADLVDPGRPEEVAAVTRALLGRTTLAGVPVVIVSAETGLGLGALRSALVELAAGLRASILPGGPARLPIDRVFAVRGRGTVVTGTLRGAGLERGSVLQVLPGSGVVRVREIQVHGGPVERAEPGRTALNIVGGEALELRRGVVLAAATGLDVSDRLLVALRPPAALRDEPVDVPAHGTRLRLHLGTDHVEAVVSRGGREGADLPGDEVAVLLRLERPVAAAIGDRFVLRRPSPGTAAAGGRVLDSLPPRGVARRRITPERLAALAAAARDGVTGRTVDALVELHGALPAGRLPAGGPPSQAVLRAGPLVLAPDVSALLAMAAARVVRRHHELQPLEAGIPLAGLRAAVADALRQATGAARPDAAAAAGGFCDALLAAGRLERAGDRVRQPGRAAGLPAAVTEAMDRLEAALAVPAPPPLDEAARAAGCPPEGIRALLAAGRLVRLTDDVVYSRGTLADLEASALALARRGPLTPAAFRDATGTSRKYVLAILEDLDRRGLLRRMADGHVPGPRAPAVAEPEGGEVPPDRTGDPAATAR